MTKLGRTAVTIFACLIASASCYAVNVNSSDSPTGTPPIDGWTSGNNPSRDGDVVIYNGVVYTYVHSDDIDSGTPGNQPGYMWQSSVIPTDVNVVSGGKIHGTAATTNAIGGNTLRVVGTSTGTVEADFIMKAATPVHPTNSVAYSASRNNLTLTTNQATNVIMAGKTVDVGWGQITIGTGATIAGNIITSGTGSGGTNDGINGSSTWNISGGTFTGNLTSYTTGVPQGVGATPTGDVFNITGTETSGAYSTVFDNAGSKLTVTANSTVNFGNGATDAQRHVLVDNYTVATTGSNNHINILGYSNFTDNSLVDVHGGKNFVDVKLGSLSETTTKHDFDGNIEIYDGGNYLTIGGNTNVTTNTNITVDAASHDNTLHFTEYSLYAGDQTATGNRQRQVIDMFTQYKGWNAYQGVGNTLLVDMDVRTLDGTTAHPDPDDYIITGQVVYNGNTAGAINKIEIKSGQLYNLNGSIMGSDTVGSYFDITGGNSLLLVSGKAKSDYLIHMTDVETPGGIETDYNVDNIRGKTAYQAARQNPTETGGNAGDPSDYLADFEAKDNVTNGISHTVTYQAGTRADGSVKEYTTYSLLNFDKTTIDTGAIVHIGALKGGTGDDKYNPVNHEDWNKHEATPDGGTLVQSWLGNQITTNHLEVKPDAKIYIHEDERRWGSDRNWVEAGQAVNRNVVNTTEVYGALNIDRTTIHGTQPGKAVVNVHEDGWLLGFGEYKSANNHDPKRAQIVGNLNLFRGSNFKPYDPDNFTVVDTSLRGTVHEVQQAPGVANSGHSHIEQRVTFHGRLFAQGDSRKVTMQDGITYGTFFSDSLKTYTADFADVWDGYNELPQEDKVQYRPTIGFHYDLKSKLEFTTYTATEGKDERHYAVVNAAVAIPELKDMPDANHLFNRDILISDMLANYHFDKKLDDKGIYLRYRLIAKHPWEGGIAIDQDRRNNANAAHLLDMLRYPFKTQYSGQMPFLPTDPTSRPMVYDALGGYDGDMVAFYADHAKLFNNYRDYYIQDWKNFFLGVQRGVESADQMDYAMRMIQAEPYASLTNVAFNTMDTFIANRERNSVSALFQVESNNYEDACRQTEDRPFDPMLEEGLPSRFIENPVRFWASGFGRNLQQNQRGQEYGYNADIYGGSVGVIKEFRDIYAGFTFGYADVETRWHDLDSRAKTDSYMFEALVGARIGMGFVELHGNYAYNDQEVTRHISLPNYVRSAKADYHDNIYGAGIRAGYQHTFGGGKWLLIPTVGFTWMRSDTQGLDQESGRYDQAHLIRFHEIKNRDVFKAPVMVRLNRAIAIGSFVLSPEIRAGFAPMFGDTDGHVKYEYVGFPTKGITTTARGLDTGWYEARFGGTLELSRRGRFYVAGNYDFYLNNKGHSHNYSLQAGLNF